MSSALSSHLNEFQGTASLLSVVISGKLYLLQRQLLHPFQQQRFFNAYAVHMHGLYTWSRITSLAIFEEFFCPCSKITEWACGGRCSTDSYFHDFAFNICICQCIMTNIKDTNMRNTAGKSANTEWPCGVHTVDAAQLTPFLSLASILPLLHNLLNTQLHFSYLFLASILLPILLI